MINRKQTAELLNHARYSRATLMLEAAYTAADDTARSILQAHPDLRERARFLSELKVQLAQGESDYRRALEQLRQALDPEIPSASMRESYPSDSEADSHV
jgi:nitrate reductase assembly molybdenum cofactor insertion protein NarJ